jgi:hypothetical protein
MTRATTEMELRVAETMGGVGCDDYWIDLARASIRAMHTPTTEMLRDVNLSATCSADDIAYMWETMIDAASPQMSNYYKNPYSSFNEIAQKAINRFYRNCLDATREQMNKIEVTDEMEQRFCDYVNTHEGCTYRAALEAALNPPPEPEIKVTWEMGKAGHALALKARNHGACGDGDLWVLVKDIYRAMRKLEPNQ